MNRESTQFPIGPFLHVPGDDKTEPVDVTTLNNELNRRSGFVRGSSGRNRGEDPAGVSAGRPSGEPGIGKGGTSD